MNFTKLPNGMEEGFVLLKKYDEKTAKNGSKYIDLILADKAGEISAKLWDAGNADFELDEIVKVRGNTEQYNGKNQFRISQIRHLSEDDHVNPNDYVPSTDMSGEKIFQMLRDKVCSFKDEDFKKITLTILDEKHDVLIKSPAAFRLHHAMLGGLMLHTASIVKVAEKICEVYDNIDEELLICGAILHDVQKTAEFEFSKSGLVSHYSVEGELIGHVVSGVMCIDETAKKLGVSSDKALLLEHMVLSHHGAPEYGSPVYPMFIEAEILSTLDKLDADIFEFNNVLSNVNPGEFSERQWSLDNRKLYNHALTPNEHKVNLDS